MKVVRIVGFSVDYEVVKFASESSQVRSSSVPGERSEQKYAARRSRCSE